MEDTGAFLLTKGFEIESAYQGLEGLNLLRQRFDEGQPFALAVVDIMMPPGLDGVETALRMWNVDPHLQVLLCAQHFNHSWSEIAKRLSRPDSYLLVRKPFLKHEILQMVYALTEKWALRRKLEKNNEKRYRALYHQAPAMFITMSRKGRILSANDFGTAQLGYSSGALEGLSWGVLHPPDVRDAYREHLVSCLRAPNAVFHWQGPKLRKDGTLVWVWVRETSRTLLSEDGKPAILSVCDDVTQVRRLERMLVHQSKHDLLTGLVNRKELEQRLVEILSEVDDRSYALCLFDLDQFRVVNDACGHEGGDELLRQVTHLLRGFLGNEDTAARIVGDEFVIVRANCTPAEAKGFAESIRDALNAFRFVSRGKSFFVGVSGGVVPFSAQSNRNVPQLIEAAEAACDAAKEAGRNQIRLFEVDAHEVVRRQSEVRWVGRLQDALNNDRFVLYQQPIVPTTPDPNHGHHYEILLRLCEDDGTIVLPGAFIPAAERYGLVVKIDTWVVANTLRWLRANPVHAAGLTTVSLNLSGRSLTSHTFLGYLLEELEDAVAEKICFEITETAAVGNLSSAASFIEEVRRQGCSFSLDDFGSGLSSFGYLKNLPVDYLKIDGSFIKHIAVDPEVFAMVRSIAEVARTLGKKTVAEFVEDDAIRAKLVELDVDYAQGYVIGHPAPLAGLSDAASSFAKAG